VQPQSAQNAQQQKKAQDMRSCALSMLYADAFDARAQQKMLMRLLSCVRA